MNRNILTGIVVVAALVVCGAGWLLLPLLQDSRRVVEADASVQLERARRLLHKYNAGLAYESLLIDQLGEEGIEADPQDVSDTLADEYQQIHASAWDAYQPNDWREQDDSPKPARASYGNLSAQIRDGLRRQEELVDENEDLLGEALNAVQQALSVSHGGESSRTHAEATRLKGIIFYHMGMAERIRAQRHRREGDRHRHELIALTTSAVGSQPARTLVADSHVEEQIAHLAATAAEMDAAVSEDRRALDALDAKTQDIEGRLSSARSRRDDADEAMRRLKTEGIDFSDPNGAESFRVRLEALSQAYREANREAHALEYGTYPGRDAESGSTTDLAVEHGLLHYQNERTILAARLEGQQHAADDLRTDITRLEGMKAACQAAQDQAKERITEAAAAASDIYTELSRSGSEAFTIEDTALDLFDQAARVSRQAATYAENWVSDAHNRTRGLSFETQDRSAYGSRRNDDWMAGYTAAQAADVHLAKAWIQYARYHAYTQSAEVLAEVAEPLLLNEADVESERVKAKDAHDAGVEEVKEAMEILKDAHRKTGGHWAITAQAAGTTYLLTLFGHEDYLDDTIEAYRNALKDREDKPYAQTYVTRLNRLEER